MAMECQFTVEDEFKKNKDLKSEDLRNLREWLSKEHPNIPQIPEKLLILFIHSCYYDVSKTKNCIQRYYELRANSPDFFKDRNIQRPELQTALNVLRYSTFPVRDPNGYIVIFHKLHQFEPSKYVFAQGVKLKLMAMDAALQMYGTTPGYIMMFDMHGVRLGHLLRLSLSAVRRYFQYIQEANPVRLKAIHVVNTNPLIDKILFLVKPFVQKELLELLHFHSGSNETLYQYLPKNCLPCDYGGDLESVDELHKKQCKILEDLSAYFQEEEEYRQ